MLPELDIDTVPGIVARALWSLMMLFWGYKFLAFMYEMRCSRWSRWQRRRPF